MIRGLRARVPGVDTLIRAFLVIAVFLAPSIFDLGSLKPFDYVKLASVWFFGWLAFGLWIVQIVRGRARPRRFRMGTWALAYLAATALATVLSKTLWVSIFGWYGRYNGFATMLLLVVLFFLVANVYRDRRDRLPELVYAMGAGSLVLVIYILIQWVHLDPIHWASTSGGVPGERFFGTMGNANFAGGYLGLTFPWLFYAFNRASRTWLRGLVAFAALAQFWALWLTSARNGLIALGMVALVLLVVYRRRVPRLLKAGAAAVAAVALLLAVVVIWHPGSAQPPAALRKADVLRSNTIRVRGYWWMAGLKVFAHHPLTGTGPDSYVVSYHRYLSARAAPLGDTETADNPHNVYIERAANTGLLGVGTFVVILAIGFRRGFRRLRESAGQDRLLIITFLALLGAYVGQAAFSIDVTAIASAGWVVLGALAALADPDPGTEGVAAGPRRRGGRAWLVAVVMVLAAALAAAGTLPLMSEHEERTAKRLADHSESVDVVMAHHDNAIARQPLEPVYRGTTGTYLEQQALNPDNADSKRMYLEEAVAEYKKMDELQPGYFLWKMTVGEGVGQLAAAGDATFDDAYRWLDEAVRLSPYDWRVSTKYGDTLSLEAVTNKDFSTHPGLLCRALKQYKLATSLRRTEMTPWLGYGRTLARLGHLQESLKPLRKAKKRDRLHSGQPDSLLNEVQKLIDTHAALPVVNCP